MLYGSPGNSVGRDSLKTDISGACCTLRNAEDKFTWLVSPIAWSTVQAIFKLTFYTRGQQPFASSKLKLETWLLPQPSLLCTEGFSLTSPTAASYLLLLLNRPVQVCHLPCFQQHIFWQRLLKGWGGRVRKQHPPRAGNMQLPSGKFRSQAKSDSWVTVEVWCAVNWMQPRSNLFADLFSRKTQKWKEDVADERCWALTVWGGEICTVPIWLCLKQASVGGCRGR